MEGSVKIPCRAVSCSAVPCRAKWRRATFSRARPCQDVTCQDVTCQAVPGIHVPGCHVPCRAMKARATVPVPCRTSLVYIDRIYVIYIWRCLFCARYYISFKRENHGNISFFPFLSSMDNPWITHGFSMNWRAAARAIDRGSIFHGFDFA